MITRRLDAEWDMCFGHAGDDFLTGVDATKQKIKSKLQHLQGEWFLDPESGFPWEMMARKENAVALEANVKAQILSISNVDKLINFRIEPKKLREIALNITLEIQGARHEVSTSIQ